MSIGSEVQDSPRDIDMFVSIVSDMKQSVLSARDSLKPLIAQLRSTEGADFSPGISLLTLKAHVLLSYMQSLALLSSHKALGHSLETRTPHARPFSDPNLEPRGDDAGDLVDELLRGRVVLEKVRMLEGKMKYQIDKLVRAAKEKQGNSEDVINDPLSFRPNLANLVGAVSGSEDEADDNMASSSRRGLYQPPRVAPMPYTDAPRGPKGRRERAPPIPTALSNLSLDDPANPHLESASGLGNMPSLSSARSRELDRMTRFEEENFTRLVMKKRDSKRRKEDEAAVALGGLGRRVGGLEDEFEDVLRGIGRSDARAGLGGDGYEELRMRAKEGAGDRRRKRGHDTFSGEGEEGKKRKKGRFEEDIEMNEEWARRRQQKQQKKRR